MHFARCEKFKLHKLCMQHYIGNVMAEVPDKNRCSCLKGYAADNLAKYLGWPYI